MKLQYGRESLDVKSTNPEWYDEVESFVKSKIETTKNDIMNTVITDDFENQDIYLEEVTRAIDRTNPSSAPSPEEKVFTTLIKKGGDNMTEALVFLFQKCWSTGTLCDSFKLDPKILMPKPGKDNYNTVRSYRPITLESVISKIFQRTIARRLIWRLEISNSFAPTQDAYRKQHSCVQSMIRVVNNIQEAKSKNEYSIAVFMDFESCFEKVWRAGLLYKTAKIGICGRMLLYLYNYINDRKFYLRVNEERSEWITSKVGIPQGSVLSPLLCNLYTSDAMDNIKSKTHTEFADDNTVVSHSEDLDEASDMATHDTDEIINNWCPKWNMGISTDKTEVVVVPPPNTPTPKLTLKIKDKVIKQVSHKKVLGIIVDENLDFNLHIQERKNKGFKALKCIEHFINNNNGCSQNTFVRLYKSLVLPTMDYGIAALSTVTDKASKELNQVQRAALLKATGCLSNSSTEAVEILSNCNPLHLHLKLRQAEELLRIHSKHDTEPVKQEFDISINDQKLKGKKTTFNLLLSAFTEMKAKFNLENVAKEFQYTKELMGLCRQPNMSCKWEEFEKGKTVQEENIKLILDNLEPGTVSVFTDGSALGNPGPTGAGAVIYHDGLDKEPICISKPVCSNGNNYIGELIGILTALQHLVDQENLKKNIHFFIDCQPAITSAFGTDIPRHNVDVILNIRQLSSQLQNNGHCFTVHWIPGHKDFKGNELADKLAKEGAKQMEGKKEDFYEGVADRSELLKLMKHGLKDKWQQIYTNSTKTDLLQEIISEVGKSQVTIGDRKVESIINQIITGQVGLNQLASKIDQTKSDLCETCSEKETIQHYVFHCEKYNNQRNDLERDVEEILARNGIVQSEINLKVLTGNLEEASRSINGELKKAFGTFLRSTERLIKNQN